MAEIVVSKVKEVVIYPDRARLTAEVDLDLAKGEHRIIVDELPIVIVPQSVRVSGRGAAQVRLSSVDVRRSFYERTPVEKVKELEDAILELNDEKKVLTDEEAILAAQGEYIDGLRRTSAEYAKGLARGKTKVEDYRSLAEFLQTEDQSVRRSMRDLQVTRRELEQRLDKLINELKVLESGRPTQTFRAQVDLDCLEGGAFTLQLSYIVNRASWTPLYDIRLEHNAQHKLDITMLAEIKQNTGMDWEGVSLSVSTARPALSQKAPELKPWYIDAQRPQPAPLPRKMSEPQSAALEAPAAAAAHVDELRIPKAQYQAEPQLASLEREGGTATFRVSGMSDIPGDGTPHKTTIAHYNIEPGLDYLAVPKLVEAVYRRVKIQNEFDTPLLSGKASLFAADEFIGTVDLAHTAPGDELELLFGPEDGIAIERELTQRDVEKTLLRDRRELIYRYDIRIKNLLAAEIMVEVQDHIPVSRHEEIKVKLENATPTPDEHSDLNMMSWQLAVSPEKEKSIQYEFGISHPRQIPVFGLVD